MKALSLCQPFASLVATGKKTIETRVWPTRYRGRLLICAGLRPWPTPSGYDGPPIDSLPRGVALCTVRVVNCRPMTKDDEAAACCELYPRAWAWELADVEPVEPFPVLSADHVPAPSTAEHREHDLTRRRSGRQ
jgi:hypothetical protein